MKATTFLKVGIAPYEEIKKRTLAIAAGTYHPSPNDPKIWFSSIESLAKVLSSKNRLLMELIEQAKPQSVTELAEVSGRKKSNLSRTLKTLARYGLVDLERKEKGRVVPHVAFKRVQVDLSLNKSA